MKTVLYVLVLSLVGACARPVQPSVAAPDILERAAWGARAPVLPMKPHTPERITIHHTGVRSNAQRTLEQKLRGLQLFSQREDSLAGGARKPAWPDIPYHYYIDIAGQIAEARDVRFVGDTNTSYDPTGHILVVVEGNFQEEHPTPAQLESLRRTVQWLAAEWRIPAAAIRSHKDYAQTECPGVNLYDKLDALRAVVY